MSFGPGFVISKRMKPELDKNPIPTSPPTLTPIVLEALHVLLAIDKPVLARLLLLGQDVDFMAWAESGEYLSLESFVSRKSHPEYDALKAALSDVNTRFLGENPWTKDRKGKEREFWDVKWCQDYLVSGTRLGLYLTY